MRTAEIFAVAALISFAPDLIAIPRASWRRSPWALALHVIAQLFLFSLFMLITARPVFSAVCSVALVVLMGVVSNAKFKTLREPFVFSDLSLFAQLFRHPRLYLPFLGARTIGAAGAAVALLALGCWLETPNAAWSRWLALVVVAASVALGYRLAARLPLTLDASVDQQRHGFFSVFVAYLLNGLNFATPHVLRAKLEGGPFAEHRPSVASAEAVAAAGDVPFGMEAGALLPTPGAEISPADEVLAADAWPDVIMIQSESYFDARRISDTINPALYTQFDRACRESVSYGELTVQAWGANTMRSEFSVLTGLASENLGYARFYPYAFLRRACASLPSWFKRHGYATQAIHPYYADFFGRDRVFPLLGFDKFQDIEQFADAQRAGPYVSDAAVADSIITALDEAPRTQPRFVFAMTMENHGPLHLETVRPGESKLRHTLGDGAAWHELTVYLRHIENADAMLGRLLARLRARRRPAILCWYGDHVPALSGPFQTLGVMPDRSDYFIWRNFGEQVAQRRDVRIEALGPMVLDAMRAGAQRRHSNEFEAATADTTTDR